MKKLFGTLALLAAVTTANAQTIELAMQVRDVTDYVNPFIGTSNFGATQPGPVYPGGFVSMSPFNVIPREGHRINTNGWISTPYVWENKWTIGFTNVNLSGVGCPDFGSILLMPTHGKLEVDFQKYATPMDQKTARAGYFSGRLTDYNILAEMTTTPRSSRSRYTFPQGESNILVNIGQGLTTESGCYARIVSNSEIEGFKIMGDFCYSEPQSVVPVYFVVRTNKPAEKVRYWKKQPDLPGAAKDWSSTSGKYKIYEKLIYQPIAGNDIGVAFSFTTVDEEQIEVSVGVSFVSIENARENLNKEQGRKSFDDIYTTSIQAWEKALNVAKLEGGTDDQRAQFYTAIYHNWIHPFALQDVNGDYPEMESGRPRRMPEGMDRMSMFSGWDVYRLHPFFGALFFPERQNNTALSLMQMYQETGNLPKFEIASKEFSVMSGDAALPFLTGCYFLGLTKGIDTELLYQAMLKNATLSGPENRVRGDQDFYLENHYLPLRAQYDNSTSQAIELYMADWNLGQVAKSLGKTADYKMLNERAMGYKKYFDKEYGLLRPILPDGTFMPNFNPREGENFAPANGFHEGSSWNYSFAFPYDVEGLIGLFGSKKRFVDSLSVCFDKGYFDMGNEPDMVYPYLFSFVKGYEWKTQYYVDQCLQQYYSNGPGGLPGNDDAGTLSAWQNFSMMGIYPYCPGKPEYVITTPTFDKVTIQLDPNYYSKKELVIEAVNRTPENIYIDRIELNGKPYKSYFISHKALTDAGRLTIYCTNKPKK